MPTQPRRESAAESSPIQMLLQKARDGDATAGQELFDRYADQFLRVIRAKLAPRLRTIFDSADFLQETRLAIVDRPWQAFASVEAFVAFVSKVAEKQVLMANRKYLDYQRNNLKRELPLQLLDDHTEPMTGPSSVCETIARKEQLKRFMQSLPLLYQRIAILMSEQSTQREIADELKIDERTIRRIIKKISDRYCKTLV